MVPAAGAALIRLASYPNGLELPPWPNLTTDQPEQWQQWLDTVWTLPGFSAAVEVATPQLAQQVTRALAGEPLSARRLRRLVETVVRYLLRWTTRATPFGTFAGIAPVEFGPRAAVRCGDDHRVTVRPDGRFIDEHTARAEQDLAVLRTVAVVANSLGYRRGRSWVLPVARIADGRRWDLAIRLTAPVQAAIDAARSPVPFKKLAAAIAGTSPGGAAPAERLLAALVQHGVLLSQVRPPMTVTDPAEHLARSIALPDPAGRVAVDLRVDASVTLPPAVLHEAGRAASVLAAVAPHFPGWAEYHRAFIDRWGPGAAVPLRDVVRALGFPAGYRGSTRRVPAAFTDRDRILGRLAQICALDGCAEVVLDDELVGQLSDDRAPVPHSELRFTLAAETLRDLDAGAFTLTVVSGSRHAGASAARFLHLLTPDELARFREVYESLPTVLPGAETVQLSGPPLDARLVDVARAPQLLPVLPVGDFHPDPPWTLADLAIAGDGQRLWLVSQNTGRPVEPLLLNSVLLPDLQQPMMRFLTEIWTAWTAPCSRFDWSHASHLPFLPRVRHGRSILHPACWLIDQSALPAAGTPWTRWRDAWQRGRDRRRVPRDVLVGDDDVRLRLNLDDDTHLAVLRTHVDRHRRTVLTEAPGPAGWIGGRPAEVLLTLTHAPRDPQPARPSRPVTTVQHRPGASTWLEARLYGPPDDILTDLATRADGMLHTGWWFVRYPDPLPHLRLRIPIRSRELFSEIAGRIARWVAQLDGDGVVHDYALHTYRPETRHGTGPTLAAAEAVFAADSRSAVLRLTGERHATTAASMIAIADGFTGCGLRWLATHVPHHSGPRLDPAQLALARRPYSDQVLAAALTRYRSLVGNDGLDPDQVLADLLHLHHARMIGVDTDSERHCLRLARTIARSRWGSS